MRWYEDTPTGRWQDTRHTPTGRWSSASPSCQGAGAGNQASPRRWCRKRGDTADWTPFLRATDVDCWPRRWRRERPRPRDSVGSAEDGEIGRPCGRWYRRSRASPRAQGGVSGQKPRARQGAGGVGARPKMRPSLPAGTGGRPAAASVSRGVAAGGSGAARGGRTPSARKQGALTRGVALEVKRGVALDIVSQGVAR